MADHDTREVASRTPINLPKDFSLANTSTDAEAIDSTMKKYGLWIMRSMIRVFCEEAARFTPPNMGRSVIEEKYYFRPILSLIKLVRGEYPRSYATPEDKQMLKQGYRFKILNTKYRAHKKGEAFAYSKGINEAKRLSRIKNRGLSRYTWGDALNNKGYEFYTERKNQFRAGFVEVDLPPIFLRLARKSPNITKYHFGKRAMTYRNGVFTADILNRLAESEVYCRIAIQRGTAKMNQWSIKFFNKVKRHMEADIVKLLEKTKLSRVTYK